MSNDRLTLKWGSLKAWSYEKNEAAQKLIQEFYEEGMSMSAMAHRNTEKQKQILCRLIDVTEGEIYNDWEGASMSKEQAKKYVMEYQSTSTTRSRK